METLEPFIYDSLDLSQDSIRLLRLTGIDEHDRIKCTLRHARRSTSRYIALSYTWGMPEDEVTIVVNDQAVQVRRNLYDFLQRRASQLEIPQPVRFLTTEVVTLQSSSSVPHELLITDLWIDALCLDQNNAEERNHQVQQMFQIYSDAEIVLTWLGEVSDPDTISWLTEQFPSTDVGNITGERVRKKKMRFTQAEPLLTLLNRSYWTRVWVIQEITAAQQIYLMVDSWTMTWDHFWSVVGAEIEAIPKQTGRICVSSIAYKHYNLKTLRQEKWSLWALMESFPEMACSEIRDRVYGLLSFTANAENIIVDYDIDKIELALQITSACLPESWQLISLTAFDALTKALGIDARQLMRCPSLIPTPVSMSVEYSEEELHSSEAAQNREALHCLNCKTEISDHGIDTACVEAVIYLQNGIAKAHVLRIRKCSADERQDNEEGMWIGPLRIPYNKQRVENFLKTKGMRLRNNNSLCERYRYSTTPCTPNSQSLLVREAPRIYPAGMYRIGPEIVGVDRCIQKKGRPNGEQLEDLPVASMLQPQLTLPLNVPMMNRQEAGLNNDDEEAIANQANSARLRLPISRTMDGRGFTTPACQPYPIL